ncbi:MAG: DUF115 domain-containing protein [Aquificaceae bacterium]|nr:DUF115 domain-containing protein [Aquificaceae bacterium]MDW8434314.1 DUF115 domain-containing protein [Aquificaceae bacterium]
MEVLHKSVNPEALARSLMARREANLLLMQREFPSFYKFFTEEKGSYQAGIQIDPEHGLNLVVNGVQVYQEEPYEQTKKQFENYLQRPTSIRQKYSQGIADFKKEILDHRYAVEMLELSPLKDKPIETYYTDKALGVMIVFGVGLGYHLEMLTEEYDIKNLIIVDADPEVIKVSLYTIDWIKILRNFTKEGRLMTLITGKGAEEISKKVIDFCRSFTNQALFFNVPFYVHIENPIIGQVINTLLEKFSLLSSGWGFFHDEFWSLEQTIENIRQAIPVLTPRKVSKKYPVFIIGSGPSLDDSIPFLKKNMDRALVVSCGSSVSTLKNYGIVPDFHVEIERTKFTYDYLVDALEEGYLAELRIIANNPMHPSVFTLGKEQYMFVKPNDTGALLFDPSLPRLYYANPTVVNGGLALFLSMGFEEIYLFGADMGFKDPERHHSSGHLSLKKGSRFYQPKEGYDRELEGNFGGKVLTNRLLFWAKDSIERLLEMFPQAKVYNLSDGARIEGTIPLRPQRLSLSSKASLKEEVIKEATSLYSDEPLRHIRIGQFLEGLKADMDAFIRGAEELFRDVKDKDQLLTALSKLFVGLSGNERLSTMLRGGFFINESVLVINAYAIEDRGEMEHFVERAKEVFLEYLRACRHMMEELS